MFIRSYIKLKEKFSFFTNLKNSPISSLLVILTPLLLLRHETLSFIYLSLLSIFGFYQAIKNKTFIFNIPSIRYVSLMFYGLLILIMISAFLHDDTIDIYTITMQEILFGLSPLIAYSIMTSEINLKSFISYIKISLVLVGIYVLFKNWSQTEITQRVLWPSWMGALLFIFTLIKNSSKRKEIYAYIIDLIYYFFAIFAIIECSSRSAILTLILLLPIVFLFNTYSDEKKFRKSNYIDFLIVLSTLILCISFSANSKIRLYEAAKSAEFFLQITTNTKEQPINFLSTFDQRKILFQAGFEAFIEKPIFGNGYQNTTKILNRFYSEETKKTYLVAIDHLHNTYLNMLVQFGIFGLIFYIYFFCFLPLNIFLKALLRDKQNYYAIQGILLIFGYCILGLADTMYLGVFQTSFFIFFISLSLGKSLN